jgi:serine/threonine protein kinase
MADPNFRDNLDFRADLYTTALTVYEYASGHHPIAEDNDDPIRTVTRAIRQQPTPLATHRPEYSPQFTHLIDQLLKKKPALRPANLKRLIQMMEA